MEFDQENFLVSKVMTKPTFRYTVKEGQALRLIAFQSQLVAQEELSYRNFAALLLHNKAFSGPLLLPHLVDNMSQEHLLFECFLALRPILETYF